MKCKYFNDISILFKYLSSLFSCLFSSSTWPRRLARSTGYDPAEIAYGVTKVAAQCLRALSSNEQQEAIHRDLMHKYARGPAAQLIKYEQALNDIIQPDSDEN